MSTRNVDDPGAADGPVVAGGPRAVTAEDVRRFARRAERILLRHRAHLDRLDALLGDGDHGENMSVGFGDAVRTLEAGPVDVGDLLRQLGHQLVAGVGGAGGSLYGTAFIEAGIAVVGRATLGPREVGIALDAAAEGIARRGRCRLGDKTIYDALRPAADAYLAAADAGGTTVDSLRVAAMAAAAGMRATRPLIARRGLALRLGERSRGPQDPGATSCFLLLRAMIPDRAPGP